jgi:hypothetical protein
MRVTPSPGRNPRRRILGEQFFEDQGIDFMAVAPDHGEHDDLEPVEADFGVGQGQGALDDGFAQGASTASCCSRKAMKPRQAAGSVPVLPRRRFGSRRAVPG